MSEQGASDGSIRISAAVELGNASRATLGLLPVAAYYDAAAKGTLALARDGAGRIVGYALYGLAAGRVRLTHLCIDKAFRRRGIAQIFVEWISERHADYAGILVRCRHDYGLGELWVKLGFVPLSEAPGRSRAGQPIVSWWRDHGHPNIFSRPEDSVLVRAAVDLNVLRDLADRDRPDHREAAALVSDQISDRLELVRTSALDLEINNLPSDLRGMCLRRADGLRASRGNQTQIASSASELLVAARLVEPGFPGSPQDEFDLQYVAEAAAAGVNVFVTRDERLTELLGPVAEQRYGLRILRPAELVVHIDELVRAEAYRPAALLDTGFSRRLIGAGQETLLLGLVDRQSRERPADLRRLVRELTASQHERVGVFAPDGRLAAAFVGRCESGVLAVPLLRVADDPVADTLARQLMYILRQQARDGGASVIRLADPHLPRALRLAAVDDGFVPHEGEYHAFALDVCAPARDVEHAAVIAARSAGLPAPVPLRAALPAVVAAALERAWWPAKIIDSALQSYLVPIRQPFSVDLLGVPSGLFPRQPELGLSREHVYYRSPGGPKPKAPARVLWYMSGSGTSSGQPAAVIACSQLEDVVCGPPEELHSRFRHLGVWDLGQIRQAAKGGTVQALRFSNTEIFAAPIRLPRLRELARDHAQHGVPQSPMPITADLFAALYVEGGKR
jgi:GNAT superfamily N-acetyltransferase